MAKREVIDLTLSDSDPDSDLSDACSDFTPKLRNKSRAQVFFGEI